MNWNDLTKQNKLLIYIYYVQMMLNRCFSYNIDGEHLIYHWDITSNITNLRDIGNQLLKKKLICYYDITNKHIYLMLTSNGFAYATYLIKQLGDNNPFEMHFDANRQPNISKCNANALTDYCNELILNIHKLEKENEELKSKFAEVDSRNDDNDCDHMLETMKDLEAEIAKLKEEKKNLKLDLAKMLDIVDSKKEIIDNLSKSLSEAYAKLDKKNKENEYLTDILKKKLDAEKKMVAWTESIIEGNAC